MNETRVNDLANDYSNIRKSGSRLPSKLSQLSSIKDELSALGFGLRWNSNAGAFQAAKVVCVEC